MAAWCSEQQRCKRAGWTGIRRGAWDDYRCFPARQGWRGLVWVLEVEDRAGRHFLDVAG